MIPQCASCARLRGIHSCEAYDIIPDEIYTNQVSHVEAYAGDRGLRYVFRDGAQKSNANDCHDETGRFCETGGSTGPNPETAKHAAVNPKSGGRVDKRAAPTSFKSADGSIDFSKASEKDVVTHFARNYQAEIEIPGMQDPEVRSRFLLQTDKILSDFQGTGVISGSQAKVRIHCPTKDEWDNDKTGFGQPAFPVEEGPWMITDTRGYKMSLNPYAMSDMAFMQSEFDKGTEWHADGVYNLEGAVTHEMGHMLENSLKWNHDTITGYYTNDRGEIGTAFEAYAEDNSDAKSFCKEATLNRAERFAEAFAAHYHGTPEIRKTEAVRKMSTLIDWTKNGVPKSQSKYYKDAERPGMELKRIKAELAKLESAAKSNANDCHDAETGQFCETGGGGSSGGAGSRRGGAWKSAVRGDDGKITDAPAHVQALRVPPAWTSVRYDENPEADLILTGVDKKGRTQYVYSERFANTQKQAKFDRIQTLSREFDDIRRANEENRFIATRKEEADTLHLIMETGIRPGSERDTGAEKQAYGATTLQGQHVVWDDKSTRLVFTGKKGVSLNIPVTNPDTARMLQGRATSAGLDGRLFNTDAQSLSEYTHSLGSGTFKTKDFRTLLGTTEAMNMVKTMPRPTSKTAFKKAVSTVAKAVSQRLGNTPSVALKAYIAPEVFTEWQTKETGFGNVGDWELFGFDIHVGTACPLVEMSQPVSDEIPEDDEDEYEGGDLDQPCPPDVAMALGFDPDDEISNQTTVFATNHGTGRAGKGSLACTGPNCYFANAESRHKAIVQSLNRWIQYGPRRFYYGVDNFRGSEGQWDGVPLIYAQKHPDHNLVATDLGAALQTVRAADGGPGRVVGRLTGTRVVTEGQPRLESDAVWDDHEVEALYRGGQIALSSAFTSTHDESGRLDQTVRPNHVLVFAQSDENQPRDPGTMFLNQEDIDVRRFSNSAGTTIVPEDASKLKQIFDQLAVFLSGLITDSGAEQPPADGEEEKTPEQEKAEAAKAAADEEAKKKKAVPAQKSNMTEMNASRSSARSTLREETDMGDQDKIKSELEAANQKMATLTQELEAKNKELEESKKSLAVFEQGQRDAAWANMKTNHVPKGWLAGEGKEAELRKEFETQPVAFANKILEHVKSNPAGDKSAQDGTQFGNKGGDDSVAAGRELRQLTGR